MKSLFAVFAAVCAFAFLTPSSAEAGFFGIRVGVGGGNYCAPHYGGGYGGGYYRGVYPVRVYRSGYYGGGYNRVCSPPPAYYGGGSCYGYGYRGYAIPRVRYVDRGYYGHGGHYGRGVYYGGGRYCR